jgi:hypothetical protein
MKIVPRKSIRHANINNKKQLASLFSKKNNGSLTPALPVESNSKCKVSQHLRKIDF